MDQHSLLNVIETEEVQTDPGIDLDDPNFSIQDEIDFFKDEEVMPCGYGIKLRLYITPKMEETPNGFKVPKNLAKDAHADKIHSTRVGLVVKMAPGVYKDSERYKFTGPYCKLGDWVVFALHNNTIIPYKGKSTCRIAEDAPLEVVSDPRFITNKVV